MNVAAGPAANGDLLVLASGWDHRGRPYEESPSFTQSNTLAGSYVVPGFTQDSNWWLFDLGVSRDFGKVTGFISGNASAGKTDGDYWSVTVGIRVPL